MQLDFWYLHRQGSCLLFWWVWGSWPMSIAKWIHKTRSGLSTWQIRWESFLKIFVKTFPGNRLTGYPLHPTCLAGPLCKVQVVVAVFFPSSEYSRRSKSDGSTLPFLYKLSWGLEVKVKASLDVRYFLRTWRLPFPSLSLFSTGLCCILILWSTVGWRYGFSPTELMKVPLHAFLDTTGRVRELLCACPQYGDT